MGRFRRRPVGVLPDARQRRRRRAATTGPWPTWPAGCRTGSTARRRCSTASPSSPSSPTTARGSPSCATSAAACAVTARRCCCCAGRTRACTAVPRTPCPPFSATPWPWWTSPPGSRSPPHRPRRWPAAAVELRHLVAELVDEAAAASPGARVEVDARLEPDGALGRRGGGRSRLDGRPGRLPRHRRGVAGRRAARPALDRRDPAGAAADRPPRGRGRHPALPGRADHRARRQRPLVPRRLHPPDELGLAPTRRSSGHDAARLLAPHPRPAEQGRRAVRPAADSVGRRYPDLRGRRVGVVPRRRARARDGRLGVRGRPRVA